MAVVVFCRYYYYPTGGFAGVMEDFPGMAKPFLRIAPFPPQKVVKNLPHFEISMGVFSRLLTWVLRL